MEKKKLILVLLWLGSSGHCSYGLKKNGLWLAFLENAKKGIMDTSILGPTSADWLPLLKQDGFLVLLGYLLACVLGQYVATVGLADF